MMLLGNRLMKFFALGNDVTFYLPDVTFLYGKDVTVFSVVLLVVMTRCKLTCFTYQIATQLKGFATQMEK